MTRKNSEPIYEDGWKLYGANITEILTTILNCKQYDFGLQVAIEHFLNLCREEDYPFLATAQAFIADFLYYQHKLEEAIAMKKLAMKNLAICSPEDDPIVEEETARLEQWKIEFQNWKQIGNKLETDS